MSKCRFKVSKSVEHPRNYNSCQAGFFCYGYYTAPCVLFQSYFYANFKKSMWGNLFLIHLSQLIYLILPVVNIAKFLCQAHGLEIYRVPVRDNAFL